MSEKVGILERTKVFALRIIRLYSSLPKTPVAQVIGKQVLRSGTSVGARVDGSAMLLGDALRFFAGLILYSDSVIQAAIQDFRNCS